MKHTPGPWHLVTTEYKAGQKRLEVLRQGYSEPIAQIHYKGVCNGYHYTLPAEANALLISLAPDLAAMLRRFVDGINDEWHPLFHCGQLMSDEERTLLVQAGALLKKLEG